jgi:hypothetical protein
LFSFNACKSGGSEKSGSAAAPSAALLIGAGPWHTSHNLRYERADAVWSTNYQVGSLIPAGSKVASVYEQKQRFRNMRMIIFTLENGSTFKMPFVEAHHAGMTLEAFAQRLFTDKTFDQLSAGLSQAEIDAVKRGQLMKGMSKKAVILAWGYPPESQTFSLENTNWVYNVNRFRTTELIFDNQGKLAAF